MWYKIRLAFPVLFVGIILFQIYGHFARPSLEIKPEDVWRGPEVPPRTQSAVDPGEKGEENVLSGEFRKLCNVLSLAAGNAGWDPPPSLPEALAAVETNWPDKRERFQAAFRYLLDSHAPGTDPWGKPCIYRLDPQKQTISLHSFGPDRRDDATYGDDVYVTMRYGRHGHGSSSDGGDTAEETEETSQSRIPLIVLLTSVALAAGWFGFRQIWGSSGR
jgi:hypothetical protein